jgi:hypothetical protein
MSDYDPENAQMVKELLDANTLLSLNDFGSSSSSSNNYGFQHIMNIVSRRGFIYKLVGGVLIFSAGVIIGFCQIGNPIIHQFAANRSILSERVIPPPIDGRFVPFGVEYDEYQKALEIVNSVHSINQHFTQIENHGISQTPKGNSRKLQMHRASAGATRSGVPRVSHYSQQPVGAARPKTHYDHYSQQPVYTN